MTFSLIHANQHPVRVDILRLQTHKFRHNFECQGCGASMSYDAEAQTLLCPFCGSDRLQDQPQVKSLAPRRVVPFAVDREAAIGAMRTWLVDAWRVYSDVCRERPARDHPRQGA